MDCYRWNQKDQCFEPVDEPVNSSDEPDWQGAVLRAGYRLEFSSQDNYSSGASLNVYRTLQANRPPFIIDICGQETRMATFLADDFLSLLYTLKQLQPFLTLAGIDHTAASRNFDRSEQETR